MGEKRYRRLVLPGRFQPPHLGHVNTIKYALSAADSVIIIVGSAQESFTQRNPLTAGERIELLEKVLDHEVGPGWCERVSVVPVMDINMNKVWVQYLIQLLPRFEGVVSGNGLVQELFRDMGLAVVEPPMYRRDECSGSLIRRKILEGDDSWVECVPKYILEDLYELGFVERLRRVAGEHG